MWHTCKHKTTLLLITLIDDDIVFYLTRLWNTSILTHILITYRKHKQIIKRTGPSLHRFDKWLTIV